MNSIIDCAPAASVEDVKVGVTHRGPVCLVWEVSWPLGKGRHPPVECLRLEEKNLWKKKHTTKISVWCHRACVAPAAAVPVEAAGAPGDAGGGRQGPALPVIEGHVIHGEVAASPGSAPDTLDNNLS